MQFTNNAVNPNLGKVVSFTNITDKDFTHAYGGQPFSVKAGETVPLPYDLGKHLAKHLARRIFLEGDKSASVYDPNDKTGGVGKPLWNEDMERQMIAKILGQVIQESQPEPKSETELLKEQVADLQKRFGEMFKAPTPVASQPQGVSPVSEQPVASSELPSEITTYMDKADVIAQLKEKGITFDARQSKAKLEALLKESK